MISEHFENFVLKEFPNVVDAYEIWCFAIGNKENLIGKKVVSIRGGFSNIGGGTKMIVDKITHYREGGPDQVSLSAQGGPRDKHDLGWSTPLADFHKAVKFDK